MLVRPGAHLLHGVSPLMALSRFGDASASLPVFGGKADMAAQWHS